MTHRDFTIGAYRGLLTRLVANGRTFRTFSQGMGGTKNTIILRHDVDRLPRRSLSMAQLEAELGIAASYFFRTKPHTFQRRVIEEVARKGHEVGYHYEDLADADGDLFAAWMRFRRNLARLRAIAPVTSISMHGRPFSKWDGRDLWKHFDYRTEGILCEAYLDVDWSTTRYFTDTGRTWNGIANVRDRPGSSGALPFLSMRSTVDLGRFLCDEQDNAVVSTHPERWAQSRLVWLQVVATDRLVNLAKCVISRAGQSKGV